MDVLPSELIRECLLRVPYTSHHNIAAVCRSWRAEVKSPDFYEERKKFGISQQYICLTELRQYLHDKKDVITVYDPVQGTSEELPPIPHFPGHYQGMLSHYHCLCVNRKLVLIGGRNPNEQKGIHTVFIYDFSSAQWSRGTNSPLEAVDGACSASPDGLIYVAGGKDRNGNAMHGAAVYNVEKDEWELLPHMNQQWDFRSGAFIDGKFFVVGGLRWLDGGGVAVDAEVYDPEKGAWATLPNILMASNGFVGFSLGGVFYLFQEEEGVKVYDSRENVWRSLGSLPQALGRIRCCTPWRDRIFVSAYVEGTGRGSVEGIGRHNVFYMWKPPRMVSGAKLSQDEVAGEWSVIPIKTPMDCDQLIQDAVTLEI